MWAQRFCRCSLGLVLWTIAGNSLFAQATKAAGQAAHNLTPAQTLYAQHCAACHGQNGDGQGLAAAFLYPKPRNFRGGKLRLQSTDNNVPSRDDLDAALVRGMPGSSMPSWAHLSVQERSLLIDEIFRFREEGAREKYILHLKQEQQLTDEEIKATDVQTEIATFVKQAITSGKVAPTPAIGPADPAAIARGKEHFAKQGCVSCHGAEGKGDGIKKMIDDDGFPTRPRDLTRGIFKGGHDPASLFLRVARGMPGTPMPSTPALTEPQVVELVHYLRSLSTEEQRLAPILRREKIVVRHVAGLPADSDASAWRTAPAMNVRLTPLWWRDDAVSVVQVQAVHDGRSIAFRLEWEDSIANTHAGKVEAFKDAVAMELVLGPVEPFFGMGSTATPIDLWMWDADRGQPGGELEDVNPRVVVDVYPFSEKVVETAEFNRPGTRTAQQPALSLPAQAAGNQVIRASPHPTGGSSLAAAGPGSTTFRFAKSQLVAASGRWSAGRWTVLLRRSLGVPAADDGVSLAPGQTASIAFAVWEGAHRDRNGQKQVSIWQDLILEAAR